MTIVRVAITVLMVVMPGSGFGGRIESSDASGVWDATDAAMTQRLADAQVAGGALLVVHVAPAGITVLHRHTFGAVHGTTAIPIASASKWLTAATVMTLVDERRLNLDDPVSRYLPSFGTSFGSVTVRELLSHTSGIDEPICIGDPSTTLARCVDTIARSPGPRTIPGSEFHYSSVGFAIAARIVEVITGQRFEQAFEARIARPIGMRRTRFDAFGTSLANPDPAASARSTLDDYGRFVETMLRLGVVGTKRVLSESSVTEIERDQVAGRDTRTDAAVMITGIPTYGLGVWRDVVGPSDESRIISGNGALGFYPWIDRVHGNAGIVEVDDRRGSQRAVPASQGVARMAWTTAASVAPVIG